MLEILECVSAGKVLEMAGILSVCVNFTAFSFVIVQNNNKNGAVFGCVLLFVPKTSILDSSNFQYLDIFGFIQINFMCFTNNGFVGIHSVSHKPKFVSSVPIIHKKTITTYTTIYY